MLIPTIEASRLRLIAPGAACEEAYERFYTDEQASREYGGPMTQNKARTRLASDVDGWRLQGFGVWAVQIKQADQIVGVCGFWQGRGWPRELTWWLLPSARGQGLAYEASIAAVAHAYNSFGWDEVCTYMNDKNASARSLAIRLGGQCIARRSFPDGLERDVFFIPRPRAV